MDNNYIIGLDDMCLDNKYLFDCKCVSTEGADVYEFDYFRYEKALNEESYKYKFSDKIHEEEKKVEKDDKGNPKEDIKKIIPKSLTLEEIEKIDVSNKYLLILFVIFILIIFFQIIK